MRLGFYLYSGSDTEFTGVEKKIDNQIRVLLNEFEVTKVTIKKERTNFLKSIIWRLPLGSWGANYEQALNEIEKIASAHTVIFFYIRTQSLDRRYIGFLNSLKLRYPTARLLLEIPTYPYDYELLQNKEMWPWFFKDHFYRRYLKKYVDRIVTFSKNEQIFGIPTIRTINGIDLDSVLDDRTLPFHTNKRLIEINLLAVAQFQKSHGYERIIRGLGEYNQKLGKVVNVKLHLVGDGSELGYYKRLVKKYRLGDSVFFYGRLQGDELQRVYAIADIGLGCFGLYKRRIQYISALKTSEYMLNGLPIVTGCEEGVFSDITFPYVLFFPNDKSNIEIDKIVDYYERLLSEKSIEQIRYEIEDFCKKHCDIAITMKPVVDYLKG